MYTPFDKFKNKIVVITGFSKSGTTLFNSLLDYHPELVVYPEESKYMKRVFVQGHSSLHQAKEATIEISDQLSNAELGGAAAETKRDYSDLDLGLFKEQVKEIIGKATSRRQVFLGYIEAFYEALKRSPRFSKEEIKAWVIKRPSDYYLFHRYKKWFGDDLIWFHLRRDPYDNYTSIHLSKTINQSGKWTARHFSPDWLLSELFAGKLKKEIKNFHVIQYEDLVNNPEVVMKKVADIIRIKYSPILLEPTLNGHLWIGNSADGTVFKGVSKQSVGKADTLLSGREREIIQKELSSLRNKIASYKRYYSMMFHRHFPGRKHKFY